MNSPVDGLEGGVSVKELERHDEVLSEEGLCSAAEELGAIGALAADVAWDRQLAHVEEGVALGGDQQEIVLAKNGIVALQHILAIGIVDCALFEPGVFRKADAPAIGHRYRIG